MVMPGATFWVPTPIESDPNKKHLFIILTAPYSTINFPKESILAVNFRRVKPLQGYDKTCVFRPSDEAHPFVKSDTWVNFRMSRIWSVDELGKKIRSGEYIADKPISPKALNTIGTGLSYSGATPPFIVEFYNEATKGDIE